MHIHNSSFCFCLCVRCHTLIQRRANSLLLQIEKQTIKPNPYLQNDIQPTCPLQKRSLCDLDAMGNIFLASLNHNFCSGLEGLSKRGKKVR